jgi:hypothetical protein
MPKKFEPWVALLVLVLLSATTAHNRRMGESIYREPAQVPQQEVVTQPRTVSTTPDPLIAAIPFILWTVFVSVGSVSIYILFNEIRLQKLASIDFRVSSPPTRYPQASPRSQPPQSSKTQYQIPSKSAWKPPTPPPVLNTPKSAQPRTRPASWKEEKLHNELKALLRGDMDKLKRLMRLTMLKNPGRNMEWCYEKTIWDLERDRRA